MAAAPKPLSYEIQVRLIMYYLRRYVEADIARRALLHRQYRRAFKTALSRSVLWRHLTLKRNPTPEFFLFYLDFLHGQKAIAPDPEGKKLFVYTHPELTKAP